MTALEKMKDLENKWGNPNVQWAYGEHSIEDLKRAVFDKFQETQFLLKAFKVMRGMAIENDYRSLISMEIPSGMTITKAEKEKKIQIGRLIDREFERNMKEDVARK